MQKKICLALLVLALITGMTGAILQNMEQDAIQIIIFKKDVIFEAYTFFYAVSITCHILAIFLILGDILYDKR